MGCGQSNNDKNRDPITTIDYNNFIRENDQSKYYDDYQIGKQIGEGSYGQVYRCKHKSSGQIRALKKIPKEGLSDVELKKNLVLDVQILRRLDHPNILKTYEFYQDKFKFYIITEYLDGGDLLEKLEKQIFSETEAQNVVKQMLSVLQYSNSQSIMHRDLKLDNIILPYKSGDKVEYKIKIIDWGLSQVYKQDEWFTELVGTPLYIAPEVINGRYNHQCDMWSLGVILYIMISGKPPFKAATIEDMFQLIKIGEFSFSDPIWKQTSTEAKDLIRQMLEQDLNKRIQPQQALIHSWFKNKLIDQNLDEETKKAVTKNIQSFKAQCQIQRAAVTYIASNVLNDLERAEMEEAFKKLDSNGDGVLSRDELVELYRTTTSSEKEARAEVEHMFESLNRKDQESLNYSEFIALSVNKKNILNDKNLRMAFDLFDADGCGKINKKEFDAILGEHMCHSYKDKFGKCQDNCCSDDFHVDFQQFKKLILDSFAEQEQKDNNHGHGDGHGHDHDDGHGHGHGHGHAH